MFFRHCPIRFVARIASRSQRGRDNINSKDVGPNHPADVLRTLGTQRPGVQIFIPSAANRSKNLLHLTGTL